MKQTTTRLRQWLGMSLLLTSLFSPSTYGGLVKLAVATNFTDAMQHVAQAFEHETGHQTKITYGSSGKLFAQIQHGAPFDVFLSADKDKPHQLASKKLAVAASHFTYAIGRLALWSPGNGIAHVNMLGVLLKGDFSHLAIANAKLAPYGKAAVETLTAMGVYASLKPKLVQGENIGQAYQFVRSGNAQLGFVAYSQLVKDKRVQTEDYWLVAADHHAPIQQDAILLNKGAHNQAATDFMAYLTTEKVKAMIQSFGYNTPH